MAKNYSNVNNKTRNAEEDAYSSYADEQSKNRSTNKSTNSTNKSYNKTTNKSGTNKTSDDIKDCGKNKNAYDSTDRY